MKITFLGTGTSQGVPVIGCTCEVCQSLDYRDKRLRSSIHVQIEGKSLVIDTGPDFRQQMLREQINRLDAILFTHSHKDHIAGLDDVRAYNFLQQADMPVYGNADVLAQLKTEFYYAFEKNKYPGIPQLRLHEITAPFTIGSIKIVPLPVLHYQLPVLGFRIKNFSYITDANQIPAQTLDLLKGTKVLVLNALQREKHISHFNLDEALAMAARIGAEQTYFIHISHKLGRHKVVEHELPKSVALAYDGLSIEV
ncbi:MAG TPA: MBL fold metallo-hydrolase [Cyclobacteriaceae bacterium]|nr:MBL fold metallo-hydrolase [Cytophagales bacterium]HNT50165.1 MBL fold metallo-hydrolase [Cyclobacteriaceae bacterium]HRE68320.1 MBL fold metallo-hydrolase [Cyclobacteriaceae bacterium]HRF34900.1 MBL fold metallo-hydrolase [Cyclobacteriaceae bacterium]